MLRSYTSTFFRRNLSKEGFITLNDSEKSHEEFHSSASIDKIRSLEKMFYKNLATIVSEIDSDDFSSYETFHALHSCMAMITAALFIDCEQREELCEKISDAYKNDLRESFKVQQKNLEFIKEIITETGSK
jgi:hypothetical protein